MKKGIIVILVCALVIAGFYFGLNHGSKKDEVSVDDNPSLTGGITSDEAAKIENKSTEPSSKKISETSFYEKAAEYVREETAKSEDHINTKPEYHKFVLYDGFGVMEEDGTMYAYMWIVDMSYYKKDDGKIEQGSGSSMPYKVKFVDGEVDSYENPTDGAGNEESTRKLFPKDVAEKIIAYNFDFTRLDKEVEEYYSKK